MVYCTKCGTKNEDTALVCVSCGASLQTGTYVSRRYERRRMEQECFGLPHGGAIVGIAIGVIILLWGLVWLGQQTGTIARTVEIWPIAAIIFGILIVIGAIYGLSRRPPTPPT
jgi:uncharacterized membrane protein YvbJ